jgi:hypothetical protein
LICLRQASLRPLPLEQVQSSSGELRSVVLLEKPLERDYLARRNSPRQYCAQLLSNCFLAIVRSSFGPVKIERGEASAGELSEPGDFTGSSQGNYLNRFRLGHPLELGWGHWRLVKNHGMRGGVANLAASHVDRLIIIVIAERSQHASGFGRGGRIARHYNSRRGIQIIEQFP